MATREQKRIYRQQDSKQLRGNWLCPIAANDSRLLLILWWLAIISPSGELQYLEYRTEESCKLVERLYQAVNIKTTVCMEK